MIEDEGGEEMNIIYEEDPEKKSEQVSPALLNKDSVNSSPEAQGSDSRQQTDQRKQDGGRSNEVAQLSQISYNQLNEIETKLKHQEEIKQDIINSSGKASVSPRAKPFSQGSKSNQEE